MPVTDSSAAISDQPSGAVAGARAVTNNTGVVAAEDLRER